jgi:glycosyltransferase involved in cell wall biosynthesis
VQPAHDDDGRILFVNENIGGHATMHLHIFRALAEHPDVAAERLDVPAAGLARRALAAQIPGLDRLDLDLSPLRFALAQSARARSLIRARLSEGGITAIHAYSQHVVLLSNDELRRYPSVVSTDGSSMQNAEQLPYRRPTRYTRRTTALTERFERRVFRSATMVVAQSEWAAASIRDRYDIPLKRLRVIPFGLMPPPAPVASHRTGGPLQITFVGNGLERKGGTRLLRLFRDRLRGHCILNVVTRDRIRAEPGVRILRYLTPGDPRLGDLLAETAVFVLPSEIDKSPYSILEAMFAGVPVVSTRSGAIPELVEDGRTGLLVDHDDDALADAILTLLESESLRCEMGAAGRDRAYERFDARDTTNRLVGVIAEARELFSLG